MLQVIGEFIIIVIICMFVLLLLWELFFKDNQHQEEPKEPTLDNYYVQDLHYTVEPQQRVYIANEADTIIADLKAENKYLVDSRIAMNDTDSQLRKEIAEQALRIEQLESMLNVQEE